MQRCGPPRGSPKRSRFQSSTRLTSFATSGLRPLAAGVPQVSILYEANELCNGVNAPTSNGAIGVSILYEANELCNAEARKPFRASRPVSILYEANELCNGGDAFQNTPPLRGFNPLRG